MLVSALQQCKSAIDIHTSPPSWASLSSPASLGDYRALSWASCDIQQPPTSYLFYTIVYISEKAVAPYSSTLAWKIPWTEEPGGLHTMGSLGVGHDWATSLSVFTFMHWRRKWQPTPVFLPGESQGRGSLVGCRLWGRTESDTTEQQQQQCAYVTATFSVCPPLLPLLCPQLCLFLLLLFKCPNYTTDKVMIEYKLFIGVIIMYHHPWLTVIH